MGQTFRLSGGVTARIDSVNVNSGCTEPISFRLRNYIVMQMTVMSAPTSRPEEQVDLDHITRFRTVWSENGGSRIVTMDGIPGCLATAAILPNGFTHLGETRTGALLFEANADTGYIDFAWQPGFQIEFTRKPPPPISHPNRAN